MKLPQTCDAVVVGGGLTGLITFRNLLASGKNAILIEKSGKIGGTSLDFNLENKTALIRSYLWSVEKNMELFNYHHESAPEVLTIGKKGLTPFVGFGENKVQAIEFFNSYTENPAHMIKSFVDGFFSEIDTNKIFTHTEITKLMASEENGLLEQIEFQINGQKLYSTQEIYWTASAQDFDQILPAGQYGKLRQKVKKSKSFDCMSVCFPTPKDLEFQNSRYLFSNDHSNDGGNPWLGDLHKDTEFTYWVTYIDQNQAADHDFMRKQLKALKKFLTKAFPSEEKEMWINERITVHKASLSQLNLSEKEGRIKAIPNVKFLGSHKKFWPHPIEGKLGDLNQDLDKQEPEEPAEALSSMDEVSL